LQQQQERLKQEQQLKQKRVALLQLELKRKQERQQERLKRATAARLKQEQLKRDWDLAVAKLTQLQRGSVANRQPPQVTDARRIPPSNIGNRLTQLAHARKNASLAPVAAKYTSRSLAVAIPQAPAPAKSTQRSHAPAKAPSPAPAKASLPKRRPDTPIPTAAPAQVPAKVPSPASTQQRGTIASWRNNRMFKVGDNSEGPEEGESPNTTLPKRVNAITRDT